MQPLFRLLRQFHRDESGVFAVVFGIIAVVLVALGGAVIDYVTLEQARGRAQTALDAATLALQPAINDPQETDASIKAKAKALVLERLGTDQILSADLTTVVVNREKGELLLTGEFAVSTIFVRLVGVEELRAQVTSQATKGTANVEVAIALDVTGSMTTVLPSGQTRIDALKDATSQLVSTVLKLNKGENYAKVAIIPYSQAVNAGQYADALRGPIRPQRKIERISWYTGNSYAITSVTKGSSTTISATNHGFQVNDYVYVWDTNFSSMNYRAYMVGSRTNNSFTLSGYNTSNISGTISGGSVVKCLARSCAPVITSTGHGFQNGERVQLIEAQGVTELNGTIQTISDVTPNSFVLPNANYSMNSRFAAHTPNTGRVHCLAQSAQIACSHFAFTNAAGRTSVHEGTSCVTERAMGARDNPPSDMLMGRNYVDINNGCTSGPIVPLTTNADALNSAIEKLTPNGSTSGSLGILWSWYMLSPRMGSIWGGMGQPAPYQERHLMKAAVIMTDGEFNTVHCQGVPSGISSTDGSFAWADRRDQINCAAPNGDSYRQARAYCDAMKSGTGISVFTVGLGIAEGTPAAVALLNCASAPDQYFLATNAKDLTDVFEKIAEQITALRLTR